MKNILSIPSHQLAPDVKTTSLRRRDNVMDVVSTSESHRFDVGCRLGYIISSRLFFSSENEVKSKINTLRTYYSKELAKTKKSGKSGAGRDDVYESKWPHFKYLGFLRDTFKPRKTTSSLVSNKLQNSL